MCLYPRFIKNKKYQKNKKNGGKIPPLKDKRVLMVPIGCGKCIECLKQKSREWQVRLNEEIKTNKNGNFVTLTFNEKYLKKLTKEIQKKGIKNYNKIEENEVATLAVRRFLERWRKENKKSVKHWLITELGHQNTERIHLHGIIFTEKKNDIEKIWKYGNVYIGEFVSEKTINYIIKYVTKTDIQHKGYTPKILTSKGIGKNYINRTDAERNKFNNEETKEYYITKKGLKLALPIYYRNKIYTDEEREKLWLQKLDKEERYICGEKIDIKENEDEYYKTLEYYREKNKKMGYGDLSEGWSLKTYIEQRKNLKKDLKNLSQR